MRGIGVFFRRLFLLSGGIFFFGFLCIALCISWAYFSANWAAEGFLYNKDKIDSIPAQKVALVFGCSEKIGRRPNLYFVYRIQAAKELWDANKVQFFLVSGDNRTSHYNEPQAMRQALEKVGIPRQRIICDFAGLSTLDSVIRAKKIFGQDSLILVSQEFQNQRAIYIAQSQGMRVFGYNAKDVEGRGGWRTNCREVLARVKMWGDVHLWDGQPRHLGMPETFPELGNKP